MDSDKRIWLYSGLVLVAGVGLVTLVSRAKEAPPSARPLVPQLGPGSRLLLVGDSLAQGLAAPLGQLAAADGVAFFADGRVGTRINQWASQPWLAAGLATAKPTLILVSLGTNDMKLTDPLSERPALAELVTALRASGAQTLWIAPPTMPFPDAGVRQMIADTGLPIFHAESLVIPRGADGIHPTASGYAGFAAQIYKAIRALPVAGLGAFRPRGSIRLLPNGKYGARATIGQKRLSLGAYETKREAQMSIHRFFKAHRP